MKQKSRKILSSCANLLASLAMMIAVSGVGKTCVFGLPAGFTGKIN